MDIASGLAGGTMMTVASQTLLAATGQTMADSPSAIIIGAGPSGIAMAHELKHKLAFQDLTIYEKRDEVGGMWANSRFPGATCDLPSRLYDFSFNLNPDWSQELCGREEVLEYVNATVDRFELRPHVHMAMEAVKAQWNEKGNVWCVTLKDLKTGVEFVRYATILILAAGGMDNEQHDRIEGMDQFQGDLFRTAQWPTTWATDDIKSVKGKRVAVVGDASQLIPKLVQNAAYVKQFTKSPQCNYKGSNRPIATFQKAMFRYIPLFQRLSRLQLFLKGEYLATTHKQGATAANGSRKSEGDAENFHATTEEISKVTSAGITCANGTHDDFDVIILATGYQETQFQSPLSIIGSNDISLSEYWTSTRGAQAYYGSLISGFPNFGLLSGPNTKPTNSPTLFTAEVSVSYLSRVLVAPILDNRATTVSVRQAVEDRWNQSLQARLRAEVSETDGRGGGVNEYGRDVVRWPGRVSTYWLQTWLRGGEGVVYKGGGGAWWINYLVRWLRAVQKRTWLVLLLLLISLRLRVVRRRVDREIGRYKPVEQRIEGYLSPLRPLRDEVSKIVFKT